MQVSPAAAGTNSWIWQHPVYHAFSGQDAGILWIRGKPGSGKSVLAKSIQHKLLEQSVIHQGEGSTTLVGDWFYHRRRAGRYIQHESFLRSVLYHFLQQCPQLFHDFFVKAYRAMDPQSVMWLSEVLRDILRNVCQGSRPVICIIDAVDEAESVDILALIKKFADPTTSSRARFIVLSRPVVKIEQQIVGLPSIVVEDENQYDIKKIIDIGLKSLHEAIHSLDFSAKPADGAESVPRIRSIQRRVNGMRQPRCRSLVTGMKREAQAIEEMQTTLISKARGSILWVKLVLDRLTQQAASDRNCTFEGLNQAVNDVPQELKEYYAQIVDEVTAGKEAERTEDIRRALMWICAASEIGDITLEELWETLAILRDNFTSSTMDTIWAKRIPIVSYDELWRKVYSTYGPFIEVYNPGFSAEESRSYQYGNSSVVQLMHQSVRDFLCDGSSVGVLSFSVEEARDLVNSHLKNYQKIAAEDLKRMSSGTPSEARQVVEWLDDQKLLRLAIGAVENRFLTDWPISADMEISNLKYPFQESLEQYLLFALTDCRYSSLGYTLDAIRCLVSVNRLFYTACSQGLVTAALNMLALQWNKRPDSSSSDGNKLLDGVLLAASAGAPG